MKKIFTLALILLVSISIYSQEWKTYPYAPENSLITFPNDEGRHANEPIEWWYTTGHIIGETTGTHYNYMLTYFYFPITGIDGIRILNVSNEDTGTFFDDTKFVNYSKLATDKLDIQANLLNGTVETWKNKTENDELLPFQYEIKAKNDIVAFDLDYDTNKRPLILADTGFLHQGYTDYTYYYSQTGIDVTGTIEINGMTENVSGTGWIDRQYGTTNSTRDADYEWHSIQLSNGMDINLWSIFKDGKIPDDERFKILAAYVNDSTQYTISTFDMERLAYDYTSDKEKCYAQKWRLTSEKDNLDLIISTLNSDSEVEKPFRFYEGKTTIEGTVNDVEVTGVGFAELIHSYSKPSINLENDGKWNPSIPFVWKLNNPDDGNPILYSLEYSTDNQESYQVIETGLVDVMYKWNTTQFSDGDEIWLKLTGSSIDGTLMETIERKFVVGSKVDTKEYLVSVIEIYPNPATETILIKAEDINAIIFYENNGIIVRSIGKSQANSPINIKDLSPGVYFVKIFTKDRIETKRLIVE